MASKSKSKKAAPGPADHRFHGSWKILKVDTNDKEPGNTGGIQGAVFHLSDTGDIFWRVVDEAGPTPVFAENFDLYTHEEPTPNRHIIKFIGSHSGDKIEFLATQKRPDHLHLKYSGSTFSFNCEKVWRIERAIEAPFSLYSAYREGFFTDLAIRADNGKEFEVHKTVLKAACPQLAWEQTPPPLSCSPADVLHTILHFLYTECLPEDISEETARKVMTVAGKLPGFGRLSNLCQLYLHNVDVKNQIVSLVNDLHACGDRLAEIFSNTKEGSIRVENFMTEPVKLVYAVKQGLREGFVAGVKFLLICELFSKRKGEMSKRERHEVMKYIKSRLPIFVKQLHKFFVNLRAQLTKDITPTQKQDLALYLVPEIDKCLDVATDTVRDCKKAVENILRKVNDRDKKKLSKMDYLNRMVRNAMHIKEMLELKNAHEKISELLQSMLWRQEGFECLPDEDKAYSISKNIEQMTEDFPQILMKIEKLDAKVNDGFSMKNWKFVFKMSTSKVKWTLERAHLHRETLQPLVKRAIKLINRDEFQSGLVQLGLVSPQPNDRVEGAAAETGQSSVSSVADSASNLVPPLSGKQPNVVESLCVPPSASGSRLAKALGELLVAGVNTDMCFEVITVSEESSDIVVDHTQGTPVESQSSERVESRTVMKAHCVVIASRCDWFRRALLSGMRESIDKKIEVHDTDPSLFHQFLVFVYSGQINTAEMSTEHIVDMLSLGDRYEVDTLKHVCEAALKPRLDEDSVLFLLSIADQYHTKNLREAAMNYIMTHPLVINSDIYQELPVHLQTDIMALAEFCKTDPGLDPMSRYQGKQYDSGSDSSSDEGMDMNVLRKEVVSIGGKEKEVTYPPDSDSMSSEDEFLSAKSEAVLAGKRRQMEECIGQLRDIIGAGLPEEELERLVRAADFDVNRAVNHYYSST